MAKIKVSTAPSAVPAIPALDGEITITAKVERTEDAGLVKAGYKHDDEARAEKVNKPNAARGEQLEVKLTIPKFTEADKGTYTLWAEDENGDVALGEAISVELTAPAAPAADDDEGGPPAELRGLVWDKDFASATGAISLILMGLIAVICAIGTISFLGDHSTSSDTASAVVFLGVLLGSVLIIGGTWVCLLEMRGRAPVVPGTPESPPETGVMAKGLTKETIEAVGNVVKQLTKLRGPIAMIVVGALLVGGMAVFASDLANNENQAPPSSSTASTTN